MDGATSGAAGGDADGERLRMAETVALQLGQLLEDLQAGLLALRRWSPRYKTDRARMLGALDAGLVLFTAWQAAYLT